MGINPLLSEETCAGRDICLVGHDIICVGNGVTGKLACLTQFLGTASWCNSIMAEDVGSICGIGLKGWADEELCTCSWKKIQCFKMKDPDRYGQYSFCCIILVQNTQNIHHENQKAYYESNDIKIWL